MFSAARIWAFVWSAIITLIAVVVFSAIAPSELLTAPATAAQLLLAVGLCVILADAFFLNVTTVAFSGEPQGKTPNLAFTIFKYLLFFPPVVSFAAVVPLWMGHSLARFATVGIGFTVTHFVLQTGHHRMVREYCQYDISQEEDDDRLWDILGQSRLRRG
jgi:hypothetical protein